MVIWEENVLQSVAKFQHVLLIIVKFTCVKFMKKRYWFYWCLSWFGRGGFVSTFIFARSMSRFGLSQSWRGKLQAWTRTERLSITGDCINGVSVPSPARIWPEIKVGIPRQYCQELSFSPLVAVQGIHKLEESSSSLTNCPNTLYVVSSDLSTI